MFAFMMLIGVFGLGVHAHLGPTGSAAATPSSETSTSSGPRAPTPLSALKTSYVQDTTFFTDAAEADPALATYEQNKGNVALRALLTDGAAFCALLKRERRIDEALVAEADGARSTESQTGLPLSVTTFNTIEAVALLTLCPSEQKLLPATDRFKIRNLGASLVQHEG